MYRNQFLKQSDNMANADTNSNKWFYAALTFIYLLFELNFNARLLDITGGKPDQEAISNIEIFGRILSGIGFTILVWRIFAKTENSLSGSLLKLFVVGSLCVPTVYLGQRLLIDKLVDYTNVSDRATASLSIQIPSALLWEAVSIKGLDISSRSWSGSDGKTFLAVLPLLAYFSPELISSVEKQIRPMIFWIVRQRIGTPEAAYNNHYIPVINEIRSRFSSDYRVASQKISELKVQQLDSETAWEEYMQKLSQQPFTEESITPVQRAAVIRLVRKKGIDVPDSWNPYDHTGFIESMPSGRGEQSFRSEMNTLVGHSTTIPSGLSWVQFSSHPDIQDYIRSKFRASIPNFDLTPQKINLDASIEEFNNEIFRPQIQKITDREFSRIKQPPSSYGLGMTNYDMGRNAMRAVIVPPLALCFSLFFSLCNLAGLVALLTPGSSFKRLIIQFSILFAVVLIPMYISNDLTRSNAVKNLEISLNKKYPLIADALTWLIHAEPIYYKLGSSINYNHQSK